MSVRSATLIRGDAATAGVAAPGDRRFRRPDVRPGGRRPLSWWLWRVGSVAAVLAVLCGVGVTLWRAAMTSRLLNVRHIVVDGNTRLSTGEVEALMHGLRGQNIFQIDLDTYRQRLMDSPWVASANMRRVLPATIEVRISERTPMVIARVDGRLYLVDQEGVAIDEFGPEYREFDLPIVDGLIRTAADGTAHVQPTGAALTRAFLSAIVAAPALRQRISQFDVSDRRDVVALLDDDPTLIHLGDGQFVERLRRYLDLAPTLQERLNEIDYVDMRFDERVYVRSKTPVGAKSKAARSHAAGAED